MPDRMTLEHKILWLSLMLGALIWSGVAGVDFYYGNSDNYLDAVLLRVTPDAIASRATIMLACIVAGFLVSRVIRQLRRTEERLLSLNIALKTVRGVNRLITTETDRQRLIERVCRRLTDRSSYGLASIMLVDEGGMIDIAAHSSESGARKLPRDGLAGTPPPPCVVEVLGTGRALAVTEVRSDCGDCALRGACARDASVAVRLENGGHRYGALAVALPIELAADPDEQALLLELAGDISLALAGIRSAAKRRRMEAVRDVMGEISNAVNATTDVGDFIAKIREELGRIISTENFIVTLYDRDADTISLAYFADEKDQEQFQIFPAGKTQTAYVIRNDEPLLLNREAADRMIEEGLVENIGTPAKVWLGVPLRVRDDVIGAIVVQSYENENEFGPDDLEVMKFVSGQIGLSIERKRSVEALRAQREELETILDSVPAYIFYKDLEGRYVRVNRAFAEALGIPQSQWLGCKATTVLGESGAEYEADDHEVMVSGMPKRGILEVFETSHGTLWALTDKIPYLDKDGNVVGVIGLSVDITDRMNAEEALRGKEEELRQSQKMEAVGKLAGGVAHDFNNLLTAISGYTQLMLAQAEPGSTSHDNLTAVAQAADRAAALTRQLLAFSRRQPVERKVQDLNAVVLGMEKMLKRLIGEDVVLATDLEENLAPVSIDASMIEQILMNLAVNARDAMPEGGSLGVTTETVDVEGDQCEAVPNARPGRFVRISVTDTGIGMDRQTQKKIFEPFFTTKGPGKGTGLGLSVVYGNVKQHAGWVHVYSEPGRGTLFHIYLPAEAVEPPREKEAAVEETYVRVGTGERVLLVEDEGAVRDFAVRALRERGYTIVEAESAEQALDVFEREGQDFRLIFSDVVLPGKSGVQLVDEILARNPEIRILLTSGYADRKSQWPVIRERGFRMLQKPYSLHDLLEAFDEALH